MAIRLNKPGLANARALVKASKIDADSAWSFSAGDGNALLGDNGNDWKTYVSFHLAEDDAAAEDTKARFHYPFGKDGKIYRRAVIAIKSRAAAQNEQDLVDAADELLTSIDKKVNARVDLSNVFVADGGVFAFTPGQVPSEIPVLPIGTWKGYRDPATGKKTEFTITPQLLRSAIDQFNARQARAPSRELVIDYEHQTLTGDVAPAAGWITDLIDKGEGGLWAAVRWTERAAAMIASGEYRYISPVFAFNTVDKVTGAKVPLALINAALTNEPFFDELALAAKGINVSHITHEGDNKMDWKAFREFLCGILGLKFDVTDDQLKGKATEAGAAITEVTSLKTRIKDLLSALGLAENATIEAAQAIIISAKAGVDGVVALQARITQLETQARSSEVDGLIEAAMKEGKVVPATTDVMRALAMKDPMAFKSIVAAMPKIVNLEGGPKLPQRKAGEVEVTPEDEVVMAACGVTKELFAKHNKPAAA